MQLSDVLYWLDVATLFPIVGILTAGAFRAYEIRKALVGEVYRRRASWTVTLMIILAVAILALQPSTLTSAPFFNTTLGLVLSSIPLLVIFLVVFAFVDSNVLVAMEIDFFHRNVIRWRELRLPSYATLITSSILLIFSLALGQNAAGAISNLLSLQFLVVAGVVTLYAVVALVVSSRRTPDSTIRNFVKLLGLSLGIFLPATIIWVVDYAIPNLGMLLSGLFAIVSCYFLYRAVMALSPVGTVEIELMR
jgi:hypothetical protein